MGGAASTHGAFEQMLACTMILGQAMATGLDPRYVRFPDMYRLYDFHVGPKKHKQRSFQGSNLVLLVHPPDHDDGAVQHVKLLGEDNDKMQLQLQDKDSDDEENELKESNDTYLILYIGGDKIILDRATLNQPNNDGWTPLHACCHTLVSQDAGITILQELVARKENLNMKTSRGPGSFSCGWTPLHIACAYGLEALTLKLIRAGAEVNTTNSVGWTPLYDACHRGYTTVVSELLKAGAKHDVICPEFALCPFPGQHPLAEAARQGHQDTVKALLEWGVDKNAVNKLGWTALHEAAYHGRVAIIKMLIVYGADVHVQTQKGSMAKDLTISSEIKAMLEDIGQHAPTSSPKKPLIEDVSAAEDAKRTPNNEMSRSPSKAKRAVPLSRKEEYELLGDLPALGSGSQPTISIRDVDEEALDAKEVEEEEESKHDTVISEEEKAPRKKKRVHKKRHKEIPQEFRCAISLKLMKEPMRSPFGHVFDKASIEAWFRDFGQRCPLTGEALSFTDLEKDEQLEQRIREWKRGEVKKKDGDETDSRKIPSEDLAEDAKKVECVASPAPVEDDPYDF